MPESVPQVNTLPSILVVDDMDASLFLIESLLKNESIEVTTAKNGIEAVSLCEQNKYDIILMDIMMPQMDGFEATKAIRIIEQKGNRKPAFIFALSGNDQPGDITHCVDLGCDGHISKPINRKSLLKVLCEHSTFKPRTHSEQQS